METNRQLELASNFVQYTGQSIFLTGKAGTGKTTFLKRLREQSPKRMIVVAPTGVAAINAAGVTIHSFFQLSFGPQVGTADAHNKEQRFSKEKINIMRTLDLLVIDEISMVRADILDAIDRVMRRFKNRQKPFGGAQVLMIGDLQQLAPVIKNEEWGLLRREYDTPYFFSSKALRECTYVSIELTHIFRQQDETFISLLNKVRENRLDDAAQQQLNARYIPDFSPSEDEGYITLCTHNHRANQINDSKLRALKTDKQRFSAEVSGKFPEYSYPTDEKLGLKVGAQVMFVKNDSSPEKRFYNGKIGQVTKLNSDTVEVLCPGETEPIILEPQTWENYKYSIDKETSEIKEELEGSFTQIPLKLAWAITIHKSQGLTFERAIIDAEASFAHGQVYVALSRCKTLDGMVLLSPIGNRSIVSDQTVNGFIQHVEANQPGDTELTAAKMAFQREQLTDLFRYGREEYLIGSVLRLSRENVGSFPGVTISRIEETRQKVGTEIVEVAGKFHNQMMQLLRQNPDVANNAELQERVKKAAAYFGEKVKQYLVDDMKKLDSDIDNRTVKQRFKRSLADIDLEAKAKLAAYEVCLNGFDVKAVMAARAQNLITSSNSKAKAKEKKAPEITDFDHIPHPDLFSKLRMYRTGKSTAMGVPAFMVFSQKVLYELVNYLPGDAASLKRINGMGQKKIADYGADIIDIISKYCSENNIETGQIPLVEEKEKKQKKEKVDTKALSFTLYKQGKSSAEIAEERGLTQNTIEGHLAHFVKLGELDVNDFLSEEKLQKILEYFEKADHKSLSEAKNDLGNDVSYGDLRMAVNYLESKKEPKAD